MKVNSTIPDAAHGEKKSKEMLLFNQKLHKHALLASTLQLVCVSRHTHKNPCFLLDMRNCLNRKTAPFVKLCRLHYWPYKIYCIMWMQCWNKQSVGDWNCSRLQKGLVALSLHCSWCDQYRTTEPCSMFHQIDFFIFHFRPCRCVLTMVISVGKLICRVVHFVEMRPNP